MSELSKQALKVENNVEFPNNNAGLITPSKLRTFNEDMIDSTVNQAVYTSDSASWNAQIAALDTSGSIGAINSLNAFTASQDIKNTTLASVTASLQQQLTNIGGQSGSWITESETGSFARVDVTNTFTQPQIISAAVTASSARISNLNYPTTDNGAKSFIQTDGAGNLSLQYVDAILEEVRYGENITIGDPLYVSGSNGTRPIVWKADAAIASKMPVIYIASSTNVANTNTTAITLGLITGVTTTGYPTGTEIYVAEGGGWSANRPSGSSSIVQPLGIVTKEGAGGSGRGLVLNPGPATLPNIQTGYAWVGNGGNQPVAVATSSFGGGGSTDITALNAFTASQEIINTNVGLSASIYETKFDTIGTQSGSWAGGGTDITSLNAFTASQELLNTTFATTGSNTFVGVQSINSIAGTSTGEVYLLSDSGSLVIGNSTATPTYSALSHISSSQVNSNTNLIFKTNSNTGDTIVSGSGNIFVNPTAPTAGFKRYIGGSNNVFNGLTPPQISGSMQFSPTMNSNVIPGTIIMRGPVSASAWTMSTNNIQGTVNIGQGAITHAEKLTANLTMNTNVIPGTLNILANQTALTGSTTSIISNMILGGVTTALSSSALAFANNIINDSGFALTNQFYSSSVGLGTLNVNRNNIGGQSNQIIATGAQPTSTTTGTSISDNFILGGNNILFTDIANSRVSGSTAYHALLRTGLLGNSLIASGSSLLTDASSFGSVFVGRYNADDVRRNKTSDVVFAVGTGNTGGRKTGFLIDSGSNTFVEGTLNVSGATSLNGDLVVTGSVTASLQQGYVWVGDASGKTTTVATSSFGGGGAAFPFTGNAVITGSLGISGSMFGGVIALNVVSTTASIDFSAGNMFTLTLPSASTTHFVPTNVRQGQTINIQIIQQTPGTGSVAFAPSIKFAGGNDYQATATGSAIDLLSLVSFDGTNVLGTSIKNFQ